MKKTITFFKTHAFNFKRGLSAFRLFTFLVTCLTFTAQVSMAQTYTKITSLADLTDGDYVIVGQGSAIAMNNTVTSSKFGGTGVTITSNTITDPAPTIVWTITTSSGNIKTIYSANVSKYVSKGTSNTNIELSTTATADAQKWTASYSSSYFKLTSVSANTRTLAYNGGASGATSAFSSYVSTNTGTVSTTNAYDVWLYKKSTAANPAITAPSPTSLSGFTTTAGTASAAQTFTVGGSNLTASLVITAPTDYEVRENGIGSFGSSVSFTPSSGTVATKTIEVRIAASAGVGTPSGNVVCSSTGATTQNVAVSGTVNSASAPLITIEGALNAFANTVINATSAEQSYTVLGANLTDNIIVTPPAGFEISRTTSSGFVVSPGTLTFTPAEALTAQNIFVRFVPTAAQAYSGNITHTSAGATQVDKAVSGTGVNAEPTNQPTGLTATTNSSSQITVTWTDASGAQVPAGYIVKVAVDPSSPTAPVDGTAEADATLLKNIAQGTQQAVFTGLSASTTYNFSIWPYTNSGSSINYKTDGTVATASAATSASLPPTVLNVGDIAILQVNTVTTDRIAFVTFVDLNPGTVISFTDNGFTSATTVRTGEGFLIYTAPNLVPAGTVVSWYNGMTITGTGWNSANPSNFALGGGDQLFAYQGTWGSSQTLIYGVSLSPWVTSGGTSSITFLPSALTDNVNAFCFAASKDNAYYTNITSGTANALKSLITYNTNWTTATTNQGAQTWAFALGTSTSLTTNSSINNLVIATGETFVIGAAKQLTITGTSINNGTITILSDENGTGTIVGNVSGTATVNQHLSSYRTWYLSSPVSNVTPANMNRYKFYEEATNTWPTTAPAQTIGAGFLAVPTDNAVTSTSFSGTLNNGAIAIPLTYSVANTLKRGFNLVGNPYPSYLDWTAVYAANTSNLSTSTLWYRTKAGAYTFWTVNGESGEGSPAAANKEIAPMQAFWVRTAANGSLNLSNTLRGHAPAGGSLLKAPAASSNTLIRFEVSNGTNTDETVLYFNANASNEFDVYDSPKMSNEDADIAEIYTRVGNERLVMNGMPAIQKDAEIALGFQAGNATSFSLRANEVRNLASDVKVILKDNVTQTETDLTDGTGVYAFGNLTTNGDRFSIIFRTTGAVTGIETPTSDGLTVYNSGREQLTVLYNGAIDARTTVSVYNAVGQRLANQLLTGTTTVVNGKFIPGVYIVKVNNLSRKLTIKN